MKTLLTFTRGLTACLALAALALGAPAEKTGNIGTTTKLRHDLKPAGTLIFINTQIEDRPAFDDLIDKSYPNSYAQYSSLDEHRDRNISNQLLFGTREDVIKEIGHDTLVVVSNFRDATLQVGQMNYENSAKYWVETFNTLKKQKGMKLVLLSTDKKPSDDLIDLAKLSGGSYRKLTLGAKGTYE